MNKESKKITTLGLIITLILAFSLYPIISFVMNKYVFDPLGDSREESYQEQAYESFVAGDETTYTVVDKHFQRELTIANNETKEIYHIETTTKSEDKFEIGQEFQAINSKDNLMIEILDTKEYYHLIKLTQLTK